MRRPFSLLVWIAAGRFDLERNASKYTTHYFTDVTPLTTTQLATTHLDWPDRGSTLDDATHAI